MCCGGLEFIRFLATGVVIAVFRVLVVGLCMAIAARLSFFDPQTRQEKIKHSFKSHLNGGFFSPNLS